MEPLKNLSPSTLLKIDVEYRLSENFLSMTSSNFGGCLTKPGEMDFHISPKSWMWLRSQGGEVTTIPIKAGEEF